jgi:hypothetical protein
MSAVQAVLQYYKVVWHRIVHVQKYKCPHAPSQSVEDEDLSSYVTPEELTAHGRDWLHTDPRYDFLDNNMLYVYICMGNQYLCIRTINLTSIAIGGGTVFVSPPGHAFRNIF